MFGTLYLQQADHPLFVCPNGNLLKFKQWSVALTEEIKTREHFGGYTLLQNTDLNANVS